MAEVQTNVKLDESKLPKWNFKKLWGYQDLKDDTYKANYDNLAKAAKQFHDKYGGKLETELEPALLEFSRLSEEFENIGNFVYALVSTNMDDEAVQKAFSVFNAQKTEMYGNDMEWFTLELIALDSVEDQMKKSQALKDHGPFITRCREMKPHVLPKEVEKALTLRSSWTGKNPVVEYFMTQLAAAKYTFKHPVTGVEEELNESRLLSFMHDPDYRVRQACLQTFNRGLKTNAIDRFAALSLNIVAGERAIEDKERNFKHVRHHRNLENHVEDEVVNALLSAVRTKGVELNKRFYNLKKRIMKQRTNLPEFTWADRNAPLGLKEEAEKIYQWQECVDVVTAGFNEFSHEFSRMFQKIVTEERIDAVATPHKRGGAYCILGTKKSGPVEFTNYLGKAIDVSTVAHESGHAIHGMLTYKQKYLHQEPPLTTCETASIFGEMIVFQKLLKEQTSDEGKLEKLMGKIGDIMNTVVRQISFDRFEELVHTARKDGVVSEAELRAMWMKSTEEFYGPEGDVFDKYGEMDLGWSYVPHFHNVPFYVYSYAFADLVVGSLYTIYESKKFADFESRLIALLETGNSKPFTELMKGFELDGAAPEFWSSALTGYVEPMIKEAERLAKAIKADTQEL